MFMAIKKTTTTTMKEEKNRGKRRGEDEIGWKKV